jgi:hypothetical protein
MNTREAAEARRLACLGSGTFTDAFGLSNLVTSIG